MTDKKFTKSFAVSEWQVKSDTGFTDIKSVHETIPYETWLVKTTNHYMYCADMHIVFASGMAETFVKDLKLGDTIQTEDGFEPVIEVKSLKRLEPMYDLQVNGFNQRYYTNGILSHNTAVAAIYLLWYAMFYSNKRILIAAHKGDGADEIMDRIRYAYEECPDFIRCGVVTYASRKIVFDNKSSIVAQTTTENTGRGMSISLLYCLDAGTQVKVRNKETKEVLDITLENLYTELDESEVIEFNKLNLMRIMFNDDYFLDVPEDQTLIVNDIKTKVEYVLEGDEILINQSYYTVQDIDYID